ncbi:MFS transporter [Gordonia sp. i37]|uniref:MFS transporter n=1 Tax=Gordonia sp. i37 TaxID=1961707 RepID=UPI00209A70E6|nr:MFS transporter [Gordonia sp. i37]
MTQRTLVTGQVADRYVLDRRTLIAAAAAIALAQAALAMPAVLNGLFQDDLGTSASQLTWISAAFLVQVTLFELTFGVLGDLFGRKRLRIIGTIVLGIGQLIGFLTPGADVDTSIRVAVLLVGQVLTGVGAAAIMPTTLAMVAAGTHTPTTAPARSRCGPRRWPPAASCPRCWAVSSPAIPSRAPTPRVGDGVSWRWPCSRFRA